MQTKAMSTGFSLASCCASVTCSARTGTREFRDVLGVGDAQAVLSHVLDMRGPGIDEGHVLARLHHMRAGITADRARSDNRDLPAHAFLPAFLAAEASAPTGFSANGEPRQQPAARRRLPASVSPSVPSRLKA